MPRSGTTLIEQIIASHPLVYGAGELQNFQSTSHARDSTPSGNSLAYPEFVPALDPGALKRIGERYVASLRRLLPAEGAENAKATIERITDKMPSNYYFAGLIHLSLPNATIIHTVRDPIDTCVSCFSKLFSALAELHL